MESSKKKYTKVAGEFEGEIVLDFFCCKFWMDCMYLFELFYLNLELFLDICP